MSKEPSHASDAMLLTVIAVLLSFITAAVLWGWLVLLTEGTASATRICIVSVFVGVYLSHYIQAKATK